MKVFSTVLMTLLSLSMLTWAFNIVPAKAESLEAPVVEWTKTYGGPLGDLAYSVQQTADGGYIVGGFTNYLPGMRLDDILLLKTDEFGNMQWNKTYSRGPSGDHPYSVRQTSDGGYVFAGAADVSEENWGDAWLFKTDELGNMQWNQTYGGTDWDDASCALQTIDGGYLLAGSTNSYGEGLDDAWLVKTDEFGNMQWDQTYGGATEDVLYTIWPTIDGGYITAGYTAETYPAIDSDFWLMKLVWNPVTIELMPSSESNKAGRTIPVKFSLRTAAAVDPNQPFVRDEELTIIIFEKAHPETILQTSTYGTAAGNYRIDDLNELYITNFKTLETPATYVVQIHKQDMLIGTFEFSTVK